MTGIIPAGILESASGLVLLVGIGAAGMAAFATEGKNIVLFRIAAALVAFVCIGEALQAG